MQIAVTGATGFVGRDIVRELGSAGHAAVQLIRRPQAEPRSHLGARHYSLESAPSATLLDGIDAIVHCAFARTDRRRTDAFRTNVEGTLGLFDLAVQRKLPFLFVSSLSAIPEARSDYGRQKFALENALAPRGACIVRPGLVVGTGGLIGTLVETMRRRHIVPLIDRGTQPVQCVWRNDISAIVRTLVERGCPAVTLTIAAEPALTIADVAHGLRRALRLRARTLFLPFAFAYSLATILESLGFEPPLSTQSLLGVRTSRVQRTDDVRPLGITLLSWDDQLAALTAELGAHPGQR